MEKALRGDKRVEVVAMPGPVPFTKTAIRSKGAGPLQPEAWASSAALDRLEFPLLGRIAAGQPVEAIPDPQTFSLGDFTRGKSNIFVLRVKGDSMIDDHICDGDYILVEGAGTARNGEIVVALLEGTDATLKRFFREPGGKVRLQPANAQMKALVVPASRICRIHNHRPYCETHRSAVVTRRAISWKTVGDRTVRASGG